LYFEARYYDPLSGRFISPDPLFGEQMDKCLSSVIECNLYQYTGNNPVMYVDVAGLEKARSWQEAERKAMLRLRKQGHTILFGYGRGQRVTATRDGYYFNRHWDVISEKNGAIYATEIKFREKVKNQRSIVRKAKRALRKGIDPTAKVDMTEGVIKAGTTVAQLYHDVTLNTDVSLKGAGLDGRYSEKDGEINIRWELWGSDKDDVIINFSVMKRIANPEERKKSC